MVSGEVILGIPISKKGIEIAYFRYPDSLRGYPDSLFIYPDGLRKGYYLQNFKQYHHEGRILKKFSTSN
jgi:hypothetical protein